MAGSQCLPQAHDFFSQRKGTQVAEELHGLHSTCSTPLFFFELARQGAFGTAVATPFFVPIGSSGAWKATGLLSVRAVDSERPAASLSKGQVSVSFLETCFISPRRAKLGAVARGMRSVDTPPPTPAAGAPPAGRGPWQEPNWVHYAVTCV
jgi:hypothetical protein